MVIELAGDHHPVVTRVGSVQKSRNYTKATNTAGSHNLLLTWQNAAHQYNSIWQVTVQGEEVAFSDGPSVELAHTSHKSVLVFVVVCYFCIISL